MLSGKPTSCHELLQEICKTFEKMCAYYFSNNIYSIVLYELYQYQSVFLNNIYLYIYIFIYSCIFTYLHYLSPPYTIQYIYCFVSTNHFTTDLHFYYECPEGTFEVYFAFKESNCFFQIASVYICLADKQK